MSTDVDTTTNLPPVPQFDIIHRRPCTVAVAVEFCSDVPNCRVHAPLPALIATLTDAEERQLRHDLFSAPLLFHCPRCNANIGGHCITASGFVGGISGPHAARKKLTVMMTVAEVRAGWVAIREEQAASRRATEEMFLRDRRNPDFQAMREAQQHALAPLGYARTDMSSSAHFWEATALNHSPELDPTGDSLSRWIAAQDAEEIADAARRVRRMRGHNVTDETIDRCGEQILRGCGRHLAKHAEVPR